MRRDRFFPRRRALADDAAGPRHPFGLGAFVVGLALLTALPVAVKVLRIVVASGPSAPFEAVTRRAPRIGDRPSWDPPFAPELRSAARARAAEGGAEVALYVSDPERGWWLGIDERRPMYLASGVKLLFMIELFRQRHEGKLSFDDELRYGPEDVRDGAPAMNRLPVGARYPMDELLLYMMRDSDNAAADLLLARLGEVRVPEELRAEGIDEMGPIVPLLDVRLEVYRQLDARADGLSAWQLRDVRWRDGFHPRLDLLKKHIGPPYGTYDEQDLDRAYERYYQRGRNHASMRAMGRLLEKLAQGELVSRSASTEMIELLEGTWTSGRRVEGRLPAHVRVAHKTGTQHQRISDFAILWLPDDTPLVFAIVVAGGERLAAEDVIAELAEMAYHEAWAIASDG